MYSWIWRKLPGNAWFKATQSLVLVGGALALLWFVAFPAVRPVLPWVDVDLDGDLAPQVEETTTEDGDDTDDEDGPGIDGPDPNFDPEDYETAEAPDGEEEGEG